MRPEPDRAAAIARGFGAGLTPDPFLATVAPDAELGWTHYHVTTKAVTDFHVRCTNTVRIHGSDGLTKVCNALLAVRVTRPWTLTCRKCKHVNAREAEE